MGGKRSMIQSLSQQAMDLNYNGLFIESHCLPDEAWSDKDQQVTPEELDAILHSLVIRDTVQTTEDLSTLRRQIDEIDNQLLDLLSKRMRVSREIGHYKLEHDMPVLQTMRYDEILRDRAEQAERMDMSGDFIRKMLESIHEESVRQQLAIMENAKKENQSNQSNTI
jgi:chorismate mutase